MTDNLTRAQRSYAMSRIRSRGNRSTELALAVAMRAAGISGWRRNTALRGKPDFTFPRFRVVVFVDGCYWHGCPKCALAAKSNTDYWSAKLERNRRRDKENARQLRKNGWAVVRIWEHELKEQPKKCVNRIRVALSRSQHGSGEWRPRPHPAAGHPSRRNDHKSREAGWPGARF
jgi:DNA mismatch endonuclease (patch repair protein)